ncbi:UDP-2,4-diacetamido-2,4,6-trideoxy-beta-L-altropyranose hydrolase [Shewanella sp. 6_MG-2023]|uniref:UDP-2,4-diacetamido-2,4, 6-trideoxy-beta-L-altropyranose hydrolase n=1 Tax=Shewanella sp. 6_MG-2023 TaxID=3062660 RepID=UPI0026E487EC|nr:UDP-2,4-diacetamido-2,4,6-trideoxy-beta-L-altropyranose hydrolase [Shewanella sp. 6_MG-2023]MDO6618565.1 UDP-2,4-diacetamido-2,4,6-trideoxy-beta-L-altropyranose hydrolase [Shewanella sp. 6_MG-2023]
MKSIVFRVNAGQAAGVGHLVRCCCLATELQALGHKCFFLFANFDASVLPFLDGIEYRYLFNDDHRQSNSDLNPLTSPLTPTKSFEPNWKLDAHLTQKFIDANQVDWVVLDDYILGKEWEAIICGGGTKLMVIDDLCREHECDTLLDIRWRGKSTLNAYDDLLPELTTKLLGPQYALLASQYQQQVTLDKVPVDNDIFTVLVGVGGGGDSQVSSDIIMALLQLTTSINIVIRPILGPLTENKQQLLETFQDNEHVQPITDCFDLYPYLTQCDLYIGAAGGVLYQLLALNKPALTFSLAENQQNVLSDLEGIGHFFHCNSDFDIKQLASLVLTISNKYQRVKALTSKAVNIDGFGASRVANVILGSEAQPLASFIQPVHMIDEAYEQLSDIYRIRGVVDGDINHYLDSRNLPANKQNMIEPKPIVRLGHYAWWFNTQRDSYLLEKDNQASLYIWHQVQSYQLRDFLIGGWFVCQAETSFQDALLALNWQLEHCDKRWPSIPWIAVIHRKNRYVKLMNDYLGFKEVEPESDYFNVVSSIFADASVDEFYYVMREPLG